MPLYFRARLAPVLLAGLLFLAGCQSGGPASSEPSSEASSGPPLPEASGAPLSSSLPASSAAPQPFRSGLDFAALQQSNPDTIGWIELPGTGIDYPVMRGVDNSLYLQTDANGQPSKWGAIFTDMGNAEDFSDPVTVAYGHFTTEDSFFTQLHRFKDPGFFQKNRDVFVYTPAVQNCYEVVAAFTTGNRNILYNKDYKNPATMQSFLGWLADSGDGAALLALDDVDAQDRFLVMSTCVQAVGGDNRYLVVARLAESRELPA